MVKTFIEPQEQVSSVPKRARKKKVKEEEDPAVNYSDVPVSGGSGSSEDNGRTTKKPQQKGKLDIEVTTAISRSRHGAAPAEDEKQLP